MSSSKKKRTPKELRKISARTILIYATTPDTWNAREMANRYGEKQSKIYYQIDRAVIESCTDIETVNLAKEKAIRNATRKGGEAAGKRSKKHYQMLIDKRNNYVIPDKEAISIVERFSRSEYYKEAFCIDEHMTVELFGKTIRRVITQNLIPDSTVNRLIEKSRAVYNGEKAQRFWDSVLKEREENKKKLN